MKATLKKAILCMMMVIACLCLTAPVMAEQDGPDVFAQSYIVINQKDGSVVYSKNPDDRLYPASITKIMTALVTLEHCSNLDDKVVFNEEVMSSITSNSSTLSPVAILGEEMTVRDALFGLMLNSANECASALAVYTAGSIDAFVEMMNQKAQELGAVNTHYMNAHGLDHDDHYTTAADMALIFQAALENDAFRYIDSTASYNIPATNLYTERTCVSTNQLINGALPYEGVYAGKTGHTAKAGRTLVTGYYKDGIQLICVIMKSDNDHFYSDTQNLLDHAVLKIQGNESEQYIQTNDLVMVQPGLANGLNVREFPSIYALRKGSLAAGEQVLRIGTFGQWSHVQTANGNYYVSSEYLVHTDGTPVETMAAVNLLTEADLMPEPFLESKEFYETAPVEVSTEEATSAGQAETVPQELETFEPITYYHTAAQQGYSYQLNTNTLTIVIVAVVILIAIVLSILSIVLIRRKL